MRRLLFLIGLIWIFVIIYSSCEKTNTPPFSPSRPVGESLGFINTYYHFISHAVDLEKDRVAIRFAWGDGDTSEWSLFGATDSIVTNRHFWIKAAIYNIKAQARDEHDALSGWSTPHQIMISGIRTYP
jgi:hypothetical protein